MEQGGCQPGGRPRPREPTELSGVVSHAGAVGLLHRSQVGLGWGVVRGAADGQFGARYRVSEPPGGELAPGGSVEVRRFKASRPSWCLSSRGPQESCPGSSWTQEWWADRARADSGSGKRPGSRSCKTALLTETSWVRVARVIFYSRSHDAYPAVSTGAAVRPGWGVCGHQLEAAAPCRRPRLSGLLGPGPPPLASAYGRLGEVLTQGHTGKGLRAEGGESTRPSLSPVTRALGSPRWRQELLGRPG